MNILSSKIHSTKIPDRKKSGQAEKQFAVAKGPFRFAEETSEPRKKRVDGLQVKQKLGMNIAG